MTWQYLEALGLTVGIEVPLLALAVWAAGGRVGWSVLIGVGANLLTHGLLWTVWPWTPWSYLVTLVVLETCVFLVEGATYAGFRVLPAPYAFLAAFLLNALTTAVGLALQAR